ncbi:MAG: PKD domain-containing protein, partial [Bacteroidota bacterium]
TYPVLIDPVITTQGILPDGSGGVEGTRYSPVCWANGCDYRLIVPTPPNARLIRVLTSFEYYAATGRCQAQDGGYSISLNSCTAPSAAPGVFTCASSLSNFYCGLTDFDITSDLVSCLPPSQCGSVNLSFDLHFFRCNNDPDTNCSAACISASQPWIITLEARDLEIPFITSSQQICQGNTVEIVAVPDYGIGPYAFSWSPIAGNSDTLNINAASTGTYTVTVTDACGIILTASSDVTVLPAQNPGFSISDTVVCTDQAIQLSGAGGNPVTSYDWIVPGAGVPNGVIDDVVNPVIQYPLPGVFPVTLRYSSAGCQDDSTVTVRVTAPISAQVVLSSNPSGVICIGDAVIFTATDLTSSINPNFSFYLNGTNVQSGISPVYSGSAFQNGDLVQVVMSSNGSCISPSSDTASLFVATTGAVTPDVQIVANDLCVGIPISLTAVPTNGGSSPSFQWSIDGIPVPGAFYPIWSTTLGPGDSIISVQMISSSGCVTTPVAVDVATVAAGTAPLVTLSSTSGTFICSGQEVTISADAVNGGFSPVFDWFLNGFPTGDTGRIFISTTLVSGDVVTVELTSSSSCANPSTVFSLPLNFQVAPPLELLLFGSPPVCEGEAVSISVGITGGSGPPYDIRWNGSAGSDRFDFIPSSTQYVSVEVEDGCSQIPVSDSALVIVHPRPIAGFSFTPPVPTVLDPVVMFSDTSELASMVLWYFGDGDSSLSRNPSHQYPAPGTYQATQIALSPDGCVDSVSYFIKFAENADIWFPNSFTPNGDLINDTWSPVGTGLKSYRFYIYDRWGGLIFEGSGTKPWPGTFKDTEAVVQQGVYTWMVELDEQQFEDYKLAGQVTLIRMFK